MTDEIGREDEPGRSVSSGDPALIRAWQRTISDLAPSQRAWLRASRPLTMHGSTLIVTVGDNFTRTQLESRLRPEVEQILARVLGHEVR
ncbi:MAG: chromosomal replication initiation protein DnaA, partial [Actinomycetota bacterium]|nr:chromosomal replication initiation protein DnaA [Actinomycetota bacterium]